MTERAQATMKNSGRARAGRVLALVVALALAGVSAALASSTTTIHSTNTSLYGRILKGPSRYSLYVFCPGTSTHCTGHRSTTWPPLTASGRVVAAAGSHINAKKLATRKLSNGKRQVTYYGQPLYRYKHDTRPGSTKGEGKYQGQGIWLLIGTGGRAVSPPGYCLSVTDRIATPQGSVAVADVRPGMRVWSTDPRGRRMGEKVLRVRQRSVPASHLMVRLRLEDGRSVLASLSHPLPDGAPVSTLVVGQRFEGTRVVSTTRVRYGRPFTYDLLPAGPTHTYFADGVLLGSTLAPAGQASAGQGRSGPGLNHPF